MPQVNLNPTTNGVHKMVEHVKNLAGWQQIFIVCLTTLWIPDAVGLIWNAIRLLRKGHN